MINFFSILIFCQWFSTVFKKKQKRVSRIHAVSQVRPIFTGAYAYIVCTSNALHTYRTQANIKFHGQWKIIKPLIHVYAFAYRSPSRCSYPGYFLLFEPLVVASTISGLFESDAAMTLDTRARAFTRHKL